MGLTLVHSQDGEVVARMAHARKPDLPEILGAMSVRQLSVFLTAAGAGAVALFQVVYEVYVQGWGAPLP